MRCKPRERLGKTDYITTGARRVETFAGMFAHLASGLYLTLYRAYDPYSGRWLSRDPIGELLGGINLYSFEDEDPVDKIDPNGTQGIPGAITGAISGAIAGAAASAGESIGKCQNPDPGEMAIGAGVGAVSGGISGFFGGEAPYMAQAGMALGLTGAGAGAGMIGGAASNGSCGCAPTS